jgi:UDP-N-acetylmuramoyl-tripeptide--D-alanyl-D-alanine ligase
MQESRGAGRAIVALGDVLELGEHAADAHRQIGADMAAHGVDLVLAVGESAADVIEGVESAGGSTEARSFADKDALLAQLRAELQRGDTVLVKGSRGMGMEDIVRGLIGD